MTRSAIHAATDTARSHPGPATGQVRAPERVASVLLVDHQTTLRQALARELTRRSEFEVVGQAGSLREARRTLEDVDVAIVELVLPDGSGGELISDLRTASPDAQTLVLGGSLTRTQTAFAVAHGAAGVMSKAEPLDRVLDAVRRLALGEALIGPRQTVELLRYAAEQRERQRGDRDAIASLTAREREILQALASGHNAGAIAELLTISPRTARNHITNILAKLGVHSQLQALVIAVRYDIVEIHE